MIPTLFSGPTRACRGVKSALLLLLVGLWLAGAPNAAAQLQPARAYTFAATQGTYADLTNISGVAQDIQQNDNTSRPYPIGFPFVFEGTAYTQFIVSSEGWLSLSPVATNAGNNDLGTTTGAGVPVLAAFWDDLDFTTVSHATYATLGTAPNRELVMQWHRWAWPSTYPTPAAPTISFQIRLSEATGAIQYCYRQEAGVPAPASRLSATIGIRGNGGFLSLTDASAAPGVSSAVSTNTLNQRPATGQTYTFTPPAPCPAPTGLTATATSPTTASLSFAAGSGNASYTAYYYDVAAPTFLTTSGPASPLLLTNLTPGATYQVYVTSACNSGASSPGSNSTYFITPALPNSAATWTGAASTAWDAGGNWSTGTVPTATTDVLIPPGARQPVVTGAQSCGMLTLQTGASLTLAAATPATRLTTGGTLLLPAGSTLTQAAGTTLSVGGDLTNDGATLTLAPTSTLAFGAGQHAVNGTAATALQNLTLGELTYGDELNIGAPVSVQRLLKIAQGGFAQVLAGGSLRLLDNAQGTAQEVRDADSFLGGSVTVEHRLAGPGRHFYAAPVRLATLGQLTTPSFAAVVNPDYNTSPNPAAVLPFPTVFGYDQSRISTNVDGLADFDTGFYSPAALTDVFTPGLGYRLDAPGPATVAVTGPLTFITIPRTSLTRATLPQSGYHLLGNPYAGALDWDVVAAAATTTGLDAAVYVYQPAGAGAGTFRSYVNGVGGPRYLLPGQAFFVRVSAASTPGNVSFTPAGRFPGYFDPANPPAAPADTRPLVQLTLAGPTGPADEATAYFQAGATTGFDRAFDAHKLPTGGTPALAFGGAVPLSISGLPALGAADVTLPLDVRGAAPGLHTLTATRRLNLPAGTYLYLRDALTGTVQDLAQQPAYAFQLSTTALANRFTLLLTRTQITAVAPASLSRQVSLYPNPARGSARLELPAALHRAPLTATLLNPLGQTVRTLELPATAGPRALPLAGLAPGLYSVRLSTPQGTVTKRLVVE